MLLRDFVRDEQIDNRMCVLFDEGEIYNELKETTNNKVFSLKDKNKNKKEIVKALEGYCKKEKIDIVTLHHGGINCNLIYMMLKKKMPQLKYAKYFHSSFDKYWGGRENKIKDIITKVVMQKAINKSDLLIFISKAVKKSFCDTFKINDNKCAIVYNGINNKFIEMKPKKKENTNNITYIGRLEKLKGVEVLIKAFEEIQQAIPQTKLTIVGDGKEKSNLEKLSKQLELNNNIEFAGRQNDVIKFLDENNIFVYPSICQEGFGISVAEAMSRGCIPVTFKQGGLPELIEDGENGFMVQEVNSKELARKIIEVIKLSEKEKLEISQNAINTARKFSITNTIQMLKNAYEIL